MPKIPLFENTSQIATQSGVKINPTAGLSVISAEADADRAITEGMFNILETAVGSGQEYLKQKQEQDQATARHAYDLWKAEELPNTMDKLRKEGLAQGYDATGIFGRKIMPYLDDKALQDWAKDNNLTVTKEMQQKWDIDKAQIKRQEIIGVNKILNEKYVAEGKQLAQIQMKKGEFELAEATLKDLNLSEEDFQTEMSTGRYGYYADKIETIKNITELEEIRKTFEDDELVNFSQTTALRRLANATESSYFANVSIPDVKEAKTLLDDDLLTKDWIEASAMPAEEQQFFKNKLAVKLRDSGLDSKYVKGTAILNSSGKNISKELGITQSQYLEDTVLMMITKLELGRIKDVKPREYLANIYELINSTRDDGTKYFKDDFASALIDKITKVRGDENRNGIYTTDAVPNTYNEIEQKALNLLIDQYETLQQVDAAQEVEGFGFALLQLNEFLDSLRDDNKKNEFAKERGIFVTRNADGEKVYASYEDEVRRVVDQAFRGFRIRVSDALMNKYFEPTKIYESPTDKNKDQYLTDEQAVDSFGMTDDELRKNIEDDADKEEKKIKSEKAMKLGVDQLKKQQGQFGLGSSGYGGIRVGR
tara:strand:+ start:1041 stop:2825 length:1785 start_codon:yes stop_codon:yes gene_type:complete